MGSNCLIRGQAWAWPRGGRLHKGWLNTQHSERLHAAARPRLALSSFSGLWPVVRDRMLSMFCFWASTCRRERRIAAKGG